MSKKIYSGKVELGENSTRLGVLDVASFVRDNANRFDNPFIGVIDQRCYAGEDARSFLNQIISDSNFSGSVGSLPEKKDKQGFFSATVTSGFKSDLNIHTQLNIHLQELRFLKSKENIC